MQTPSTPWLALAGIAALLLASSCAGTVNEQGSTTATASAAMTTEEEASDADTKPAADLITANEVSTITGYRSFAMPVEPKRARFIAQTGPGDTATVAYVAYAAPVVFTDTQAGAASQKLRVMPVSSLGKGAYYEGTRNILYVRAPGHTLLVGVPTAHVGKDQRTVAVQMARLAVSRLKQ